MFHDELRAGTRTELGRKWSPMGHRPIAPVRIGYENTYLYLSLCPFTGEGYAAFLPKLTGEFFKWFIDSISQCIAYQALFVADGATAHKSAYFEATRLDFLRLPAACPELNPVERFFKEIRRGLKCMVFSTLQQAQDRIREIVDSLSQTEGKVISVTCFPYLKNTT